MKYDLFDLDVQVRSISSSQADSLLPATTLCVQTREATCYETVGCAPQTVDCLHTRLNCLTYTCPTL
ncbi:hypothetical protein EV586_102359 [Tumebacillus sp. BK434]|uniref:FDLD family class I lanthipeptide n=1 Tax=Tumebacillus sp. BK434 TaxID=2512169 RepID=UPI0010533D00|nr:FDLD family class I lanthipeptide [Tumebacillus sp. BK434]TCP57912.1 hypothetical protein EV586_102359 [Tumebacillus sp. BK434]